jgi:hypothetical protein
MDLISCPMDITCPGAFNLAVSLSSSDTDLYRSLFNFAFFEIAAVVSDRYARCEDSMSIFQHPKPTKQART